MRNDLAYEKKPIEILDCRENQSRSNVIQMVKVLYANHSTSEATLEVEEQMSMKYPHLFLLG